MKRYFECSREAVEHFKKKEPLLGAFADKLGPLKIPLRVPVREGAFRCLIGQQISMAAADSIWRRFRVKFPGCDPAEIANACDEELLEPGLSASKAAYARNLARAFLAKKPDPETMRAMTDEEIIGALTSVKGIGSWTAEMVLIFCLGRPDVFSPGDLSIRKGLSVIRRTEKTDFAEAAAFKKIYSPFGTAACHYIWAAAETAKPSQPRIPRR